ncbi:MAG: hypothetical protein AAB656_00935 [Patescibacteria group bacterium]
MKTIVLPGYSPSNKEWAEETAKNLPNSQVHYWKHWDEKTKFTQGIEANEIIKEVDGNTINILAKSLGTYVLAILIAKKKVLINKIILCGIPLGDLRERDAEIYKSAFTNFDPEKVICFQNSDDLHGSYTKISEFLKNINPKIKIISKKASNHDYPYFEDFKNFLSEI